MRALHRNRYHPFGCDDTKQERLRVIGRKVIIKPKIFTNEIGEPNLQSIQRTPGRGRLLPVRCLLILNRKELLDICLVV